jgi:hypothetical protein
MALSRETYIGDGSTNNFSVTFPYLLKAHVKLFIDGVEDTTFTWLTDSSIQPSVVPPSMSLVFLSRTTPTEPLTDFVDGSTLTESILDVATIQSLYVAEETRDQLEANLQLALEDNVFDSLNKRISNVADPVDPQDVATKAWSESALSSGVAQAAASATAAAGSATSALGYLNSIIPYFTNLATSVGSSLVGFLQSGTGAVLRSLQSKSREVVSITDFGAVEGVDCTSALLLAAASRTGKLVIPNGSYVATPSTSGDTVTLLGLLGRLKIDGSLAITLPQGTIPFTSQVVVNCEGAKNLTINGANTLTTTAVSQVGVTGSAKNYSVNIGVASSSGVSVGDYALVRMDVTGTGDYYCHAGIWKITAVDSGGANRLTLKNTHHGAAFPTNTLTGGSVVILKTVLQFTGADGFRFEGAETLASLDKVAIVGDYTLATSTGTTGTHGIVCALPLVSDGTTGNALFQVHGGAALGQSVGISGFGEQGIVCSMRSSLVANYVASCSNRKRGWYAEGGHIRAKFSIGSGNGEDGYVSDTSGMVQNAYAFACGNGLNGFWTISMSMVACGNAKATGNLQHGFEARGLARMGSDACLALSNGSRGFTASEGAMMDADSSTAQSNANDGFEANYNATIDANNASSISNGDYGFSAQFGSVINNTGSGTVSGNTTGSYLAASDSYVLDTAGAVVPGTSRTSTDLRVANSATNKRGFRMTISSVGDASVGMDSAGSGTYTSRYVWKADGTFHPAADNSQSLGRTGERFSDGYISKVHYTASSTIFDSAGTGTPEGVVTAGVGSTFRRTDGGVNTTFYVKESGTGNTGWIAK